MTTQAAISTVAAAPVAPAVLIDRAALADAVAFLASTVIEARNTIPILSGVLVEAVPAGLRLYGTDLDLEAAITLPAAWDAPGSFVVADARAFADVLKGMGGETVTIELHGASVRVSDGMGEARLFVLPVDDMPTLRPVGDGAVSFDLPAETLASSFDRVRSAISTEETRYYLNGVHVAMRHPHGGASDAPAVLRMAATDGHRLHLQELDAPEMTGDMAEAGAILPRKLVALIGKALGKRPAGGVSFTMTGQRVDVEAGAWSIRSKLIDGTFPDVARVIPSANRLQVMTEGKALADLAKRLVKARGRAKDSTAELTFSGNGCTVRQTGAADIPAISTTLDVGGYHDTAPGEGEEACPVMTIGFEPSYLRDIGAAVGAPLVLRMADPSAPALFTAPDVPGWLAVLMPKQTEGEMAARKAGKAPGAPVVRVEPVKSARDVLVAALEAAFAAGDWSAYRGALEAFRSSPDYEAIPAARRHYQLALVAGMVRRRHHSAIVGAAADTTAFNSPAIGAAARRAEREAARARRAATVDGGLCRPYRAGAGRYGAGGGMATLSAFVTWNEAHQVERAARAAQLEALGFTADDTRDVVPIVHHDGDRRFVLASALRNLSSDYVGFVKADGSPIRRSAKGTGCGRGMIASIVKPRARKATAAPVDASPVAVVVSPAPVDVSALLAAVEALAARVEGLETLTRQQAEELAARPAVEAGEASPGAGDGADVRDALIRSLMAERDAANARADAAEERAERARTGRGRTARRLTGLRVRARMWERAGEDARQQARDAYTEAHRARNEGEALATSLQAELTVARAELAGFAQLRAALAALTPAPAAPTPAPAAPAILDA